MTFQALLSVLASAALLAAPPDPSAARPISVVATTPDLASLAEAIGGAAVEVKTLAKPTEDPHFVDAKPSHIVTLNRADVLIDGGAELEMGWLPSLLESARNDKIAAGAPGRISVSQVVRMLEIPTSFNRANGDVHALGNPHFLLDPDNARRIVALIAERLAAVDPSSAALYQANLTSFLATLDARIPVWDRELVPFAGAKIVTYHRDFPYLADHFKLVVVATLEPRPGIAPSPSHLAGVIATMRTEHARVILLQPYQNRRTAETVARQADGVVLDVAQQPGVTPGTTTYFELMDSIVHSLATALGGTP